MPSIGKARDPGPLCPPSNGFSNVLIIVMVGWLSVNGRRHIHTLAVLLRVELESVRPLPAVTLTVGPGSKGH